MSIRQLILLVSLAFLSPVGSAIAAASGALLYGWRGFLLSAVWLMIWGAVAGLLLSHTALTMTRPIRRSSAISSASARLAASASWRFKKLARRLVGFIGTWLFTVGGGFGGEILRLLGEADFRDVFWFAMGMLTALLATLLIMA